MSTLLVLALVASQTGGPITPPEQAPASAPATSDEGQGQGQGQGQAERDPADLGPTLKEPVAAVVPKEALASPVVVATSQYALGVGVCLASFATCSFGLTWLTIIPVIGWILGPCALQAGFCAANAGLGATLQVALGNWLSGMRGSYLAAIAAMAVAQLAVGALSAVVGAVLIGVAVGFALPAAPTVFPDVALYLLNDPGVIVATALTSAVFFATTAASLAAPTMAWTFTAEPVLVAPSADQRLGPAPSPTPAPVQPQRY